ncbi:Exocyst complex component EXOC6/Sec15, partial [Sesbania bispinosa]
MLMKKEYEYSMNVLYFHIQASDIIPIFPYLAPFSSTMPDYCRIVRSFIEDSVSFMSYGGQLEFYEVLKKYLDTVLEVPMRMAERSIRQFPLRKARDAVEEMLFGLLKAKISLLRLQPQLHLFQWILPCCYERDCGCLLCSITSLKGASLLVVFVGWQEEQMWLPSPKATGIRKGGGGNGLVAVAVGKDKGSQYALKWAADSLLSRGQTVILIHVLHGTSSLAAIGGREAIVCNINNSSASPQRHQLDAATKDLFLTFHCYCTRKD